MNKYIFVFAVQKKSGTLMLRDWRAEFEKLDESTVAMAKDMFMSWMGIHGSVSVSIVNIIKIEG